jgi:hypothetical protein
MLPQGLHDDVDVAASLRRCPLGSETMELDLNLLLGSKGRRGTARSGRRFRVLRTSVHLFSKSKQCVIIKRGMSHHWCNVRRSRSNSRSTRTRTTVDTTVNLPTSNEVAAIMPGDSTQASALGDAVLCRKGGPIQRVNEASAVHRSL